MTEPAALLLICGCLAAEPIAWAQEPPQVDAAMSVPDRAQVAAPQALLADVDAAAVPVLEPVVVNGHDHNKVGISDAASQGTVDAGLLQVIPLLRPGEVMETVPGLVVTQHSGDGKANQYFLRGYNLDHGTDFATSIDGVPVNLPTNAHGQGYSDLNNLIPELIERIDYFKGPYFAQSGDFSAAGSANVAYRNSLEHNLASFTVGSFDDRRALLAGSVPLRNLSPALEASSSAGTAAAGPVVLGALEMEDYNGPWTTPEDLHKVNSLVRLSDGGSVRGWSVDGAYYDAHWNSTDQVPLALIRSGQLGRYSAIDPSDGGDSGRQILSGEWHSHDERGFTRLSAYAQRYRLQLFSDFSFYELRPTTGDQFEQWEHRDLMGAELIQGWNHGAWKHDSITEGGLQLRHDNVHVGLQDTQVRVPFATISDDGISETEAGAYVQNTTSWTGWLRTLAGVREQTIAMNMNAHVIAQNSGSASASKTLPKLSLIYGPWFHTEFFANWGRGFHSNDARGVIDRVDPTTRLPAAPVPALVGATGKEVGVRTEAVPDLQSSIALWSLNSESELIYNADSDIGSTSPNGASRRFGLEWNNHLVVGRHFLLDADLAWTHARYAVNNDNGRLGDFIPNAVSKVGRLRATLQALGPWSLDAETRFIGSYPLSQDGELSTPSATVINLRLQRAVTKDFDVSLDVLNALNRQYFDIAYEQDYRVSVSSSKVADGVSVHPGEPREFRLNVKFRF